MIRVGAVPDDLVLGFGIQLQGAQRSSSYLFLSGSPLCGVTGMLSPKSDGAAWSQAMYCLENFVLVTALRLRGTNQASRYNRVNDASSEQIARTNFLNAPSNQQTYVWSSPADFERESTVQMGIGRAAHRCRMS